MVAVTVTAPFWYYWYGEYRVYVIVGRGLRGWDSSGGLVGCKRTWLLSVPGMFHVHPFLHAPRPRSRHRHRLTTAHRARGGVPTCLVMITLPGEALSLGRNQEAHRSTSSHRWCCISIPGRVGGGTVSCHVPHDLVLFLFSAAAAVTVTATAPRRHCSTACSVLFVGRCRPPHAMPCNASIARALSHIDKGRRWGIWHLSRAD
jgi:hypothetical protein